MSAPAASLIGVLGWTLLHFLWQGAVVGCATALLLALMRRASAEQRYALACAALVLCVALPLLELAQGLGAPTSGDGLAAMLVPQAMAGVGTVLTLGLGRSLHWIVCGWAICAAMLALRMALGLVWVGRVGRGEIGVADPHWQARATHLAQRFGVARAVTVRVVADLASPLTAGLWRPLLLLPASLVCGMPPELLEALLAHEMAHIRRHDYLINLLQNMIEIVLFYHPAVWWISGQIRREREHIADDFAARILGEPRRLALALSELEKLQFSSHHLAQAANGGHLMSRIKRLVRPDTAALNWKAAIPMFGLALACVAVLAHGAVPTDQEGKQVVKPLADFSSCAKPIWPAASLANKETGTVTLEFVVDAGGAVRSSKVHKSSGFAALDEAAQNGIALCHFKPGTVDGKAADMPVKLQYIWTLN